MTFNSLNFLVKCGIFHICVSVTSYMQIYNELVQDLLKDETLSDDGKGLKVREHPVDGPYVESKKSSTLHTTSRKTRYV